MEVITLVLVYFFGVIFFTIIHGFFYPHIDVYECNFIAIVLWPLIGPALLIVSPILFLVLLIEYSEILGKFLRNIVGLKWK